MEITVPWRYSKEVCPVPNINIVGFTIGQMVLCKKLSFRRNPEFIPSSNGDADTHRDLPSSLSNRSKNTGRGRFSNVMSLCKVYCCPISEDSLYKTSDSRIQNTPRQESDWYSLALVKILKQDCVWQKIRTSEFSTKFSSSRYHWQSDYPILENTFHMSLYIPLPHCSLKFHGTTKSVKEDERKERIHWRLLLFQVNLLLTQECQSKKGTSKGT